jgi:hypothetical protein
VDPHFLHLCTSQLHVLVVLPLRNIRVPIVQEDMWAPEVVWTTWRCGNA